MFHKIFMVLSRKEHFGKQEALLPYQFGHFHNQRSNNGADALEVSAIFCLKGKSR